MGMYYSAAIIVGLPREELAEHEKFDDFENGALDMAPPYYDGCDCAMMGVVVIQSDDYSAIEVESGLDHKIDAAKVKFKEKTGLDGKVWLTPIGW